MREAKISEYVIRQGPGSRSVDDILICLATQRDGSSKWAVRNRFGLCMNKAGEWEDEPQNSSRSDEFLARCRFDSAQEAAAALGVKLIDPWHEAVLGECMATEGCYRESDPVGTIRSLVDWHCKTVAGIAGVPNETDAPDMQEIQSKLTKIMVAGCTCMTKTPELKYHDERCHYKLAAEVSLMLGNKPIMRSMVRPPAAPVEQTPSVPQLVQAFEWSSDYRCPACEAVFNVADDSDHALEPQRGHRCADAAQTRADCCHQTVLMGEDGPAYCADCPLRKGGRK